MRSRNYKFFIRKIHRYLGVFIGIQVFLWTVSGIFFSWTNINEIRGDHLRKDIGKLKAIEGSISPADVRSKLLETSPETKITSFRIVRVLDENYFEVTHTNSENQKAISLFSTTSGDKRDPVSRSEAEHIATSALSNKTEVKETVYLEEKDLGSHHEYREKIVPAWAVTFDHPENLTVYVSAENGQVQSFRTRSWRVFDFLWMLHTMDFIGRDDFNNWVLRVFSALSLLMIISGFLYFYMTFRKPW
ncbi:MAG: hypothetical protein DWQ47_11735 [Acidobacteria bacterium]|nr:MAG: hypothetical protein DWQ32_14150 [Acidobacteriota bacterium]REJ98244.1 MAG: hypothetical protein DWQ38_16950 [Acidobacteriota bacterium]REK16988.1 MAG: hypothetical protein DWQ43_01995 [Acidobacteriota bacterium]REK42898.1 MAG: hypothetical protein DWQ47_11735 [Acidobacteriota bacterium]